MKWLWDNRKHLGRMVIWEDWQGRQIPIPNDDTVLYYNPNTWPAEEYYRRGEELKKFVAEAHPLGVTVVEDTYDPQQFYTAVQGLEAEPERGGRCTVCYRLRMRRAAQYASENGFDWFTTTLSISPHKDAKRINAIGQELEAEFGVKHLPSDFKKHNGLSAQPAASENTACTGRITAVRVQREGKRDREITLSVIAAQCQLPRE